MAICPKDLKPCIDDLCYGSGCLRLDGEPMLERCPGGCGALVPIDGSDPDDACECEPSEWDEPQFQED
jgi:hypothetical protein